MDQQQPASSRAAWPLLLVAALSFIPVLGFFIGSAAVTWALLTDRPRARLAMGLGAGGALLNVAAFLALAWVGSRHDAMRLAQAQIVERDLGRLVVAIEAFRERTGEYPETLQALLGPLRLGSVNIYDPTRGILRTQPYEYARDREGRSYDVFSPGRDGMAGTADDIRPIVGDSIDAPGYRPVR
jgi:hypothetical protein